MIKNNSYIFIPSRNYYQHCTVSPVDNCLCIAPIPSCSLALTQLPTSLSVLGIRYSTCLLILLFYLLFYSKYQQSSVCFNTSNKRSGSLVLIAATTTTTTTTALSARSNIQILPRLTCYSTLILPFHHPRRHRSNPPSTSIPFHTIPISHQLQTVQLLISNEQQ